MSNLRNRVQLIGHLGQDPEMKTFESGKLANLRMATNDSYKSANGEWKEETTWHRLIAWGPIAERAEKALKKGAHILVEGKLTNREYMTEQKEKRYITEVRIQNFVILDKKPSDGTNTSSPEEMNEGAENNEALPF